MIRKLCITLYCVNFLYTPSAWAVEPKTIIVYGLDKASQLSVGKNFRGLHYLVQCGSFNSKANASLYRDQLAKRVHRPVDVIVAETPAGIVYRVMLGPFSDLNSLTHTSHLAINKRGIFKKKVKKTAKLFKKKIAAKKTVPHQHQRVRREPASSDSAFLNTAILPILFAKNDISLPITLADEQTVSSKITTIDLSVDKHAPASIDKSVVVPLDKQIAKPVDKKPPVPEDQQAIVPVETKVEPKTSIAIDGEKENSVLLPTKVSYDSLRILAYSGRSEEAIKLAEDYLKHNENLSIRNLLARMLAWNKSFDAAREQLHYILSKLPGDFDASDTLADIEVWDGKYLRAIATLDNALKYNPDSEYLKEKRVIIQTKMLVINGQRDQAIKLLQDYVTLHPRVSIKLYLGKELANNQQYEEAIKVFQFILSQDATNITAITELADAELALGNEQKALDTIETAMKLLPKNTVLEAKQGSLLAQINGPSYLPSIMSLMEERYGGKAGTLPNGLSWETVSKLAKGGDRKKAIQTAQEYLKTNDNSDVRILLGLMLSWEGRYDDARKQLSIVLAKTPDSAEAAAALVNVESWSDHPKEALVVVNLGLKYHPKDEILIKLKEKLLDDSVTYEDLRKMVQSGQSEKAQVLAEQSLKKKDNIDIRLLLGLIYSWNKNFDAARMQFQQILSKNPGYTDASKALADVENWNEHYDLALQLVNTALKYKPYDTDLLKKRADIIQNINENAYSPGIFDLANAVGPNTPGKKMNAIQFNQEETYVSDLKQYWRISSIGYERYTNYGPVIFWVNKTYRFGTPGTQYLIEGYPKLFKGAYAWIGYGHSDTPYLAKNYWGLEPFFSLPKGFEISLGERILQFSTTTHLYTGTLSKYIGNYWFSIRPFYSSGRSQSYLLTARRYFANPETYVSLTLGGGSGANTFNLSSPTSLSAVKTRSIRLNGNIAVGKNLILTWLARTGKEVFPNGRLRQESNADVGFIWRF